MKKIILPLLTSFLFASNLDTVMLNLDKENYDEAIKILKQQKETPKVDFLLGKAYFQRHLTYTDYILAFKYFKKANTPQSLYYLGKMYQNALGVKRDIKEAIRYYKLSNTKEAKYELAKMYLEGRYVLKNPDLGLELLKSSAKEGYNKAQFLLGKLYLNDNEFVDRDLRKAAKWLYLAAQNGNIEAKNLWNKYKLYKFQ